MTKKSTNKTILITGAAKRIGATMARHLHQQGMNLALTYRQSNQSAQDLAIELNQIRPGSAQLIQADLNQIQQLPNVIEQAVKDFGQLDALINNASSFYPTPLGNVTEANWDDIFNSNLKGAFFLSQAALPYLTKTKGCIINITDIHSDRPLENYPVYSMAKAGLTMLTKSLAKECGVRGIRVNAIAPGPILWPDEKLFDEKQQQQIIEQTALKSVGSPQAIADAAYYLIEKASYTTGSTITVDGGRILFG